MTKVITGPETRLSFVHIFEPHSMNENQEKKYSVMLLIPKSDTKTIEAIRKAQKEAVRLKWGDKAPKNLRNTLRDGDEEKDTDEQPEFKDHYFINASSAKRAPQVVSTARDANGKFKRIEDEAEVYSGCYARVAINFYGYDSNGNKGVTAGLNNVQKVRDGEPLGGAASADADFDDWEDEFEDDDLFADTEDDLFS